MKRRSYTLPFCIEYGQHETFLDVTLTALQKCHKDGLLTIPSTDSARDGLFGDPLYGTVKKIVISDPEGKKNFADNEIVRYEVDEKHPMIRAISELNEHRLLPLYGSEKTPDILHKQILAQMFVSETAIILEVGAGVGQTSLLLPLLLHKKWVTNHLPVCLEPDANKFESLLMNQHLNQLAFWVENATLQTPMNTGQKNTIAYGKLQLKYGMQFDTLFIDKSLLSALLKDDVENVLPHIHTLIVSNLSKSSQPVFLDGFSCIFVLGNYEVWQKNSFEP